MSRTFRFRRADERRPPTQLVQTGLDLHFLEDHVPGGCLGDAEGGE